MGQALPAIMRHGARLNATIIDVDQSVRGSGNKNPPARLSPH
jgi:hypothetical protein